MGIIAETWQTDEGVQLSVHTAAGLRRLTGLLGRAALPHATALRFTSCRSVHGVGMTIAIDVVFIDRAGLVTSVRELQPFRFVRDAAAVETLELRRGEAAARGIRVGSHLKKISPPGGQLFAPSP